LPALPACAPPAAPELPLLPPWLPNSRGSFEPQPLANQKPTLAIKLTHATRFIWYFRFPKGEPSTL